MKESKGYSTFLDFTRKKICDDCLGRIEDQLLERMFLGGEEGRTLLELMEDLLVDQGKPVKSAEKRGTEGSASGPIPDFSSSSESTASHGPGSLMPRPIGPMGKPTYSVTGNVSKKGAVEEAFLDLGFGEDKLKELASLLMEENKITRKGRKLQLTPYGARVLALRIQRRLNIKGSRSSGELKGSREGLGTEHTLHTKRLDSWSHDYNLVDIEKTLINALTKNPGRPIRIAPADFEIMETVEERGTTFGIIVDESGSMRRDGKLGSAMEAALSLWELIKRNPKNRVITLVFSREVKEIPPWEIPTNMARESFTDIAKALMAFRVKVRGISGDKVAYLITDSEPNVCDGRVVGFEKAKLRVLEEASKMRKENITLNVIMLGSSPNMKELARDMAVKNLGAVVFTTPENLAKTILEDFGRWRP